MSDTPYLTTPTETEQMPPGIPYIIGNEAAERFSFYGMRTILTIFMVRYLHLMGDQVLPAMNDAEAQYNYHSWIAWVYLFPIFGALISDAFTGKYRIILWVSVLYCIGHAALALMGSPPFAASSWMWSGLLLIALGAGGIKPCVSAHVGDQFGPKNQHLMEKVYQWFYFSINFGSTLSTLLTPWLLEWYGPHIAFGVPGVLMAIATLMFWAGRRVFIHVPPAGLSFLKAVFSKEGLLAIFKLGIVYVVISVFWALFDQTSSAWVLQAEDMNREWMGITWLESQIQVANPILVMLLIPVFQFVLYPLVSLFFPLTPLRKMSIGMFLAAIAFGLSAVVQGWIDIGERPSIAWQIVGFVIITAAEVMISITGLEFSYSQSPKAMKSVIMALWLASVALGNHVTALVNLAIQIPGINSAVGEGAELMPEDGEQTLKGGWLAKVDTPPKGTTPDGTGEKGNQETKKPNKQVRFAGLDHKFDTPDDFVLTFDTFGNMTNVETSEDAVLEVGRGIIAQHFFQSSSTDDLRELPADDVGTKLLESLKDSRDQPLVYDRITRDRFRILAQGPDGKLLTQWDIVYSAQVSRAVPVAPTVTAKPYTWREERIINLKGPEGQKEVDAARGEIPETKVTGSASIGGRVTLEGADYYWFWTYLMLGAAVLFVPIAYFYRTRDLTDHNANDANDTPSVPTSTETETPGEIGDALR
ncbi:MAG: MFS transporter [Planctomycetaceae bacterium]